MDRVIIGFQIFGEKDEVRKLAIMLFGINHFMHVYHVNCIFMKSYS